MVTFFLGGLEGGPMGECELHLCCSSDDNRGLVAARGALDREPRYKDKAHDLTKVGGMMRVGKWDARGARLCGLVQMW